MTHPRTRAGAGGAPSAAAARPRTARRRRTTRRCTTRGRATRATRKRTDGPTPRRPSPLRRASRHDYLPYPAHSGAPPTRFQAAHIGVTGAAEEHVDHISESKWRAGEVAPRRCSSRSASSRACSARALPHGPLQGQPQPAHELRVAQGGGKEEGRGRARRRRHQPLPCAAPRGAAARARSRARPVPRVASAFSATPTASARPGLEPAPARATARRPHGRGAEVGQALKGSTQRVGSIEQTAARDVQNGVEMLDEYIAAKAFAGEYVALQTGAVGFNDAKAIVVLAKSAVKGGLMLGMIWPEDSAEDRRKPVYNCAAAARDLRRAAREIPHRDEEHHGPCRWQHGKPDEARGGDARGAADQVRLARGQPPRARAAVVEGRLGAREGPPRRAFSRAAATRCRWRPRRRPARRARCRCTRGGASAAASM